MTADLEAILARARAAKELAGKATPGPWAWRDDDQRDMSMADALAAISLSPVEHVIWCRNNLPYEGRIASTIGACGLRTEVDAQANKDFIAAARTGWPETAADVEVLADALERLTAERDAAIAAHATSRKEAHDLRDALQTLTLKLDVAEAKQAATEGERDRLIVEVRAEAEQAERVYGEYRTADLLRAIANRGGREPT